MNKDLKKILDDLLKNKSIKQIIKKHNLSTEQQLEAMPIFQTMVAEENDPTLDYLTSIHITKSGAILPIKIPSQQKLDDIYLNNVITKNIFELNIPSGELKQNIGRDEIFSKLLTFYGENNLQKKGLYIYGKIGIGKTFILKRLAKKLATFGYKIAYINTVDWINKVKLSFKDNNISLDDLHDQLNKVDYLLIDDIGAEEIQYWFRDNILFNILNKRMEKQLPVFFTSNYSINQLMKIESKSSKNRDVDLDRSKRLIERIKTLSTEIQLH